MEGSPGNLGGISKYAIFEKKIVSRLEKAFII